MKCLICEKEIKTLDDVPNLDGAGTLTACFDYGSGHDQFSVHSCPIKDRTSLENLLACDRIKTWICDDCFEHKQHLFQGFRVKKTVEEVRIA